MILIQILIQMRTVISPVTMTNKTKGIVLVAIAAIMLVGTTVSQAPMNVAASRGGSSSGDDTVPALRQSQVIKKDGEVKHEKTTVSNEGSLYASEVTMDKKSNIDKDDTDKPANSWERTVETSKKNIDVSGSSNEKSSKAAREGEDSLYVDSEVASASS